MCKYLLRRYVVAVVCNRCLYIFLFFFTFYFLGLLKISTFCWNYNISFNVKYIKVFSDFCKLLLLLLLLEDYNGSAIFAG